MLIVSYDFTNDKTRTRFSKFLKSYGRKLQYSVYEIKNSSRVLQNILDEIELNYKKSFEDSDSILIYQTCKCCQKSVVRYGYHAQEEQPVIVFE